MSINKIISYILRIVPIGIFFVLGCQITIISFARKLLLNQKDNEIPQLVIVHYICLRNICFSQSIHIFLMV